MAKILIVEDEQIVAHEMEMALADAGHEVVGIASDEASAVRQAASGNPELVLMDIKLANNSDGIETAKLMRTRTPVAVIFVSAYLDRGTRQRAALLNPVGYLLKPYSRNQLLHTITAAEAALGRALARGDAGAVP
jgi:DNA-binding NarL/FixJ family response regulator